MAKEPEDYFKLIGALREPAQAAGTAAKWALGSLDIIDTKAGGLAGLIGGFSAAATFGLQVEIARNDTNLSVVVPFAASLVLLAVAALSCAYCLNVLSHHDAELFDADGRADHGGKQVVAIYKRRVTAYRRGHRCFFFGVLALAVGVLAALAGQVF